MIRISSLVGIFFILLIFATGNVLADVGECNSSIPRVKKTLLYQSDKENIQENFIEVTEVCTDQVVKIRSCAVISDLKEGLQQPCMDLVPQRLDKYNEIEYYERETE